MHAGEAPIDPIILSVSGALHCPESVSVAFAAGELEAENAFGGFYGTYHSLATPDQRSIELHEAFWCIDTITSGQRGELGWFQAGVYARQPLPVPLLVHAATRSLGQLGTLEFGGLRIQVPLNSHASGDHPDPLLDQFAALADPRPHTAIRARLFTSKPHRPWTELARKWFARGHVEPFAVTDVKASASGARFDNRWELRAPKGSCEAIITTPEWSPVAAAAVVLIMLEAAQAAGINGTVIVDVDRVSKEEQS